MLAIRPLSNPKFSLLLCPPSVILPYEIIEDALEPISNGSGVEYPGAGGAVERVSEYIFLEGPTRDCEVVLLVAHILR